MSKDFIVDNCMKSFPKKYKKEVNEVLNVFKNVGFDYKIQCFLESEEAPRVYVNVFANESTYISFIDFLDSITFVGNRPNKYVFGVDSYFRIFFKNSKIDKMELNYFNKDGFSNEVSMDVLGIRIPDFSNPIYIESDNTLRYLLSDEKFMEYLSNTPKLYRVYNRFLELYGYLGLEHSFAVIPNAVLDTPEFIKFYIVSPSRKGGEFDDYMYVKCVYNEELDEFILTKYLVIDY